MCVPAVSICILPSDSSLSIASPQRYQSFTCTSNMPPVNKAAFLVTKNKPLQVDATTYTPPSENEIVVKNAAVAINPYDFVIQEAANLAVAWVKLPFILGTDVAGEVVEVGKGVTRFKVGDRE